VVSDAAAFGDAAAVSDTRWWVARWHWVTRRPFGDTAAALGDTAVPFANPAPIGDTAANGDMAAVAAVGAMAAVGDMAIVTY